MDHAPIAAGHGDMAGPEQQIAAPDVLDRLEGAFLQVGIPRTGDPAAMQRRLHQPGTVDPVAAVPAPKVSRPEQRFGQIHRVSCETIGNRLHRHPAALGKPGETALDPGHRQPGIHREPGEFADLHVRLGVKMRGRGADAMGDGGHPVAQHAFRQPADIAVARGLHEGPALVPFDHGYIGTEIQLPVAAAIGGGQQLGQRGRDPRRRALGIGGPVQDLPQRGKRHAIRGRGQAAVHHVLSNCGSAPRSARAPCWTPPFVRPGAGFGCQP